jgi:HK97 family phage major capsid protein
VTADITGDVDEFREFLEQLGVLKMAHPEKRNPAASGFHQLRSLCASMEEQFPLAVETRSSPRVSVRDRRPLDRRAIMAQHAAEIAADNRKAECQEAEREKLFRDYLCYGKDVFAGEERTQSELTGSTGGVIVPQAFYNKLTIALKQYDGIFDAATLVPTSGGADMKFPLDDDSASAAAVLAENTASAITDAVFDQLSFPKCPKWSSGFVSASTEVAQDAFFDLTGLLARAFGRRFARGIGAAHTATLLTAATLGKTAASATTVTGDELLDLISSVDPMYAQNGSFLCNLTTLTTLRKLKGSTSGDYLLDIDTDANGRPTIFGYTVFVSPSMPNMTTGLKSIAFGDLSRWIRREVIGSLEVKTLKERYAEVGQIGYLGLWRVDGALAKAANSPVPVKYLQQA